MWNKYVQYSIIIKYRTKDNKKFLPKKNILNKEKTSIKRKRKLKKLIQMPRKLKKKVSEANTG